MEKTTRILRLLEVLSRYCEFTLREMAQSLGVCEKTVFRDLRLLRQAGVIRFRWSKRTGTFIPLNARFVPSLADDEELIIEGDFIQSPFLSPELPKERTKRLYLEKIIRLCTLCREMMGEEDPIAWYRARYPELSDRTRQRDFKELAAAGCGVHYVSAADSWDGSGGHWKYDCFE